MEMAAPSPRFAFVFPGQGSQSVGMLAALAAVQPAIEATFREAAEALGEDLWSLAQYGPAERLDQTVHTQPVLLAAGVAVYRAWRAAGGPVPTLLAGHSLGEYTALVCAGALSFADGLRLVRRRAELMQEAVPLGAGAMAAVLGADVDFVEKACSEVRAVGLVEAANDNAPGQVVIAGERAAVEAALAWLAERGVRKAVRLPVSVPSHCALMRSAAEKLAAEFAAVPWRMPEIPVVHNAETRPARDLSDLLALLSAQLYRRVRWREVVHSLAASVARIGECGPGRVLTGLVRRILPSVDARSLSEPEIFAKTLAEWSQP